MAIDIATFRTRFPEFASDTEYPDAQVQLRLDDAVLFLCEDKWGKWYELGVMHLAAHMLKVWTDASDSGGANTLGPITSETTDRVSYTLGVNSVDADEAFLASTPYGMEYLRIQKLVKPVAFFVVT